MPQMQAPGTPCLPARDPGITKLQKIANDALKRAEQAIKDTERLAGELEACKAQIAALRAASHPLYIKREGVECHHIVGNDFTSLLPDWWKTRCGWRCANAGFVRVAVLTEGAEDATRCSKCFKLNSL